MGSIEKGFKNYEKGACALSEWSQELSIVGLTMSLSEIKTNIDNVREIRADIETSDTVMCTVVIN